MGSTDTLEIQELLAGPSRLRLYSHRFKAESSCSIDEGCAERLRELLAEQGATFWLRSVSHTINPILGVCTFRSNFALVVRIKRGSSRREVSVPCGRKSGKALLALTYKEWSNAA